MKISAEQARIIFEVFKEYGVGQQWFAPDALYPTWLQKDVRARINELAAGGLVERNGKSRVRLTEAALKAYDEWAHGERFDRLRRVWFRSALGGTCSILVMVVDQVDQAKLENRLAGDPDFMGISMV